MAKGYRPAATAVSATGHYTTVWTK
ncbi:hypothetical protein ACWDRB_36225 [Nonomuraea sp. NPDC003707]